MQSTVYFQMTPEGTKALARATASNLYKTLSIVVREEVVFSPIIMAEITDGKMCTSGGELSAKELMDLLKA